jgi:hypothetical protein
VRHARKFSVRDFAASRPWLRSSAAKVSIIWFEGESGGGAGALGGDLAGVRHTGKFSVHDFAASRPWLRSSAAKVSLIWLQGENGCGAGG